MFNSLFGFETEYGLTVEGADATALMHHSREVVKCYGALSRPFASPWNYRAEDPRSDARGFHVEKLSVDPVDAQFDRPGERAPSPQSDRCDHILENGARFYNDHGHPEYATPECADLRSLVAHDKAGERIALECAEIYAQNLGRKVEIWKNNTDFHGASYGSHESYLMQRGVSWKAIARNLAPFLATRILFCGAGKVGGEGSGAGTTFQMSQRADFFSVFQSVDTLHNRPLVNTRDETHGDARRFRRLHVIAGDANMSEWAIAMRAGTTNLVAALIESGWESPVELRDCVAAIQTVSRAFDFNWQLETQNRDSISAVDVQRVFLRGARELRLPASQWVLEEWQEALDILEKDPMSLHDRVDWVAKRALLEQFIAAEKLDWRRDREFLQSLDLAYCNVDETVSLYGGLLEAGAMRRLVSDEEIESAKFAAPAQSRALLRGALVKKFGSQIQTISWGAVEGTSNGNPVRFALPETGDFAAWSAQIESASSLEAAAALLEHR